MSGETESDLVDATRCRRGCACKAS